MSNDEQLREQVAQLIQEAFGSCRELDKAQPGWPHHAISDDYADRIIALVQSEMGEVLGQKTMLFLNAPLMQYRRRVADSEDVLVTVRALPQGARHE